MLLTSSNISFARLCPSLQTYKQLKNGIIDSQFCAGEANGTKVGKAFAYCYAFH